MLRQKMQFLFGISALAVLLIAGFYTINGSVASKLGFYIWKLVSSKAHGGKYVSVNGVRIYCETYGAGQPVLILHGGLGRIEDMQHQIRALAGTRFVIAPDSRGHGRSTDTNEPLSYSLMADDFVKLLDKLNISIVDVVGWSDGGIIGLDLAIRHPERVRRLVAIGSNYSVDGLINKPDAAAEPPRTGGFLQRDKINSAFYRKVVTMWQTQPNFTLADLAKIKAPTLIMAGEFDIIKRSHTDQLAKAIRASREEIIAGGAHFIVSDHDQADIVNAHILRFLDEPCT